MLCFLIVLLYMLYISCYEKLHLIQDVCKCSIINLIMIYSETATKPLVLTEDEFKKLTQQGLLKFKPPQKTVTKVEIPQVQSPVPSLTPVPCNPVIQADGEVRIPIYYTNWTKWFYKLKLTWFIITFNIIILCYQLKFS